MSSSTSSLNPFAESYIPLAERAIKTEDEDHEAPPTEGDASGGRLTVDDPKLKGQNLDDPFGSSSQKYDQEGKFWEEEFSEMDLAYLQMLFPGVSEQSLVDVYTFNEGDLEASIDMLNHLETTDKLPDALDVEVASKSTSPGECSSVESLNAASKSSSSSASSDLTVVT